MTVARVDSLGRLGWAIVVVLLVISAMGLSGLLLKGYRLYGSTKHVNQWIGGGDLIVIRQNAVYSSGEMVLVSQMGLEEARGVVWVVRYDAKSQRAVVVDDKGVERQLATDRILGRVYRSLGGTGSWLIWLSSPWNLAVTLILPTVCLASLEVNNLRKKWSLEKPTYRLTIS